MVANGKAQPFSARPVMSCGAIVCNVTVQGHGTLYYIHSSPCELLEYACADSSETSLESDVGSWLYRLIPVDALTTLKPIKIVPWVLWEIVRRASIRTASASFAIRYQFTNLM